MNNRLAGISLAAMVVVAIVVGCVSGRETLHKLGWRPSEYFSSANTVELCKAISAHDVSLVKQRLNKTTASDVGKDGMTPLLWALTEEFPAAVELLLKTGADPHVFVKDDFGARKQAVFKGVAAIHVAAGMEDPVYLKMFLENGADTNFVDKTTGRDTPVFWVINRVDQIEDHLSLLQDHNANFDYRSNHGTPAIYASVYFGRFDKALLLLKMKADPRKTTINGKTRLIHLLFRDTVLSRSRSPKQEQYYQELLEWLDEHGESIEKAKAEVATGEY